MKSIAIIGAGQLGSRHLQALAHLREEFVIQVVDNNESSLALSQQRFNEVSKDFSGTVSYLNSINQLNDLLEVVIVATSSAVRKNIIVELLNSKKVKYLILEKFLFPKIEEYKIVTDLLNETGTLAWVNCPRRMFDFYKNLTGKLAGEVRMTAIGNAWGLACNGIHLLDLFSFITGSKNIQLNNQLLNKEIIASKREGYIEVTGTINCVSNNCTIELTSFSKNESPLTITIADENNRYIIQEGQLSTVLHSSRQNEWKWETSNFDFLFQSQLTHLVVNDLFKTGACQLTPYAESAQMHQLFLETILDHVKKTNPQITECLIT